MQVHDCSIVTLLDAHLHKLFEVKIPAIVNSYLLHHLQREMATDR